MESSIGSWTFTHAASDWQIQTTRPLPENLITTLAFGGKGYCRHDSFHGYDQRTQSLIGELNRSGGR